MAVSLGEIANIKGDADLAQGGFGTDAVLPENNTALAYLANAANLHAGANKYLAEVHNQRLQDYLNNFHNIDLKNLAPGDYDPLSQQYIDLSKDLADNYDVIQNPLKNRDLASSLSAREAALRSQISQSQMDKGVMDENNKFIQAHPDFNTPEYQKNVQDFWNAPLGQRKPFALNPAYVFNPADVAKKAYDTVKQKYATATTDGKYVMTAEGVKAAAPAYLQAYNTLLNSDDQYGRTARAAMLNAWNQLSPDDKALYNNDPQKWSNTQALALMNPDQQDKAKLDENQYGTIAAQGAQSRKTEGMREGFEAGQNALDRENRLAIAGMKEPGMKNGQFDKNAVGEYKNKIYHDFVTGTSHDSVTEDQIAAIRNNPNLSLSQKAQEITKLNETNSLGQNIPNEILQSVYGNDNKVKVKTGLPGETQTEQDVPAETVIGNRISNNGQAFISLRNNVTGNTHSIYVPLTKFYDDLNNVLGQKNAPLVNSAGREWLQKNTDGEQPDINKLSSHFSPQTENGGIPSVSDQAGYDALQKGAKYTAPDGKTYIKN